MKIVRYRRPIIALLELTLVALSQYLSLLLRFDGKIPSLYVALFVQTLPLVVLIRGLMFVPFQLYQGLWRYTSIWDLRNIVAAVVSSAIVLQLVLNSFLDLGYPRSILIIDALLLLFFMAGLRLTKRIYRELWSVQRDKGVLIYGAGDAGDMVVRDMKHNSLYAMEPIGFIDDDVSKVGQSIRGVRVLGTRQDLKRIMSKKAVHEVLIAMPQATPKQLREVVKALEPFKVPITTLPNLRDLLDGKVTVSQIRSLALEDLLQRAPIGLDPEPLRKLIEGRRVMVTGAGGSIGSELCRQIVRMRPELLIMIERHEHSLYSIQKDLQRQQERCPFIGRITDVTDRVAVRNTLRDFQPDIVFHAAAHKHVPLMELNACEAVKNNVGGTRVLAEEAVECGVERFILISTDKAVNPSSVMGASKRVAEFVIQSMSSRGRTSFNAVRFGNVLGSSGSVVPLFLEQIRAGGPVTVTDPEMRRYFMLIPEAVQLVLHAATLEDSGTIYVLDMGDEFKVVDLARNVIRLSGHIPDEDIAIQFTGLRPGEKMSETLVGSDETIEPAPVDKIRRVRSRELPEPLSIQSEIVRLEEAAFAGDHEKVVNLLHKMIPTFETAEFDIPVRQVRAAS